MQKHTHAKTHPIPIPMVPPVVLPKGHLWSLSSEWSMNDRFNACNMLTINLTSHFLFLVVLWDAGVLVWGAEGAQRQGQGQAPDHDHQDTGGWLVMIKTMGLCIKAGVTPLGA